MSRILRAASLGLLLVVCTHCGQEPEDPLPPAIRKAIAKKVGKAPQNVTAADLAKVKVLSLQFTEATDAVLAHLQGLTELERLALDYTKVTDEGLVHLRGLTQLRRLDLGETEVTDAGVAELEKALPERNVYR